MEAGNWKVCVKTDVSVPTRQAGRGIGLALVSRFIAKSLNQFTKSMEILNRGKESH